MTIATMFTLDNVQDGEVIHQRCVLITGRCDTASQKRDAYVRVEIKDDARRLLFPEQQWPMCNGWFKALLILTPGENIINITSEPGGSHKKSVSQVNQPLCKPKDRTVDNLPVSSAICPTSPDATPASGHYGSQRLTLGD